MTKRKIYVTKIKKKREVFKVLSILYLLSTKAKISKQIKIEKIIYVSGYLTPYLKFS
jgi:hypothetical protein